MRFTDIFVRRPVLASVVSLMILVLGVRSYYSLPVLQFPRTSNTVVTVTTTFYGADPDVIAGFITTPLENAIAQANGIDYMTSSSTPGVSIITVNLRLNYDGDKALTEISTKVSSVLNQLPPGSQQPTFTVKVGQTIDAMYIGFSSDVLGANKITDYLIRVVQPKLQAVPGVQTAELLGAKVFALRAWLDPNKLTAYGLTGADVTQALVGNDYISGIGTTKGQMVQISLTASTSLHSVEEFKNLIVKQTDTALVRLRDIATVVLGAEEYESEVGFDGKKAVYVGIQVAPAANLLDVIKGVRDVFPSIQAQLPQGLSGEIIYDSTEFVNSAIKEVISSLIQALVIVTLVVFVFLGSVRSALIPTIAIPLSLVGTFTVMLALGYSINLLTLLALVLGIGLVVDDAIIVVENVNRHLDEGMKPVQAAILAARELANPIIAMAVVLVAVYVPIGFLTGLTGALFTEFAVTLVGAVTVSAIVALTLSPMMCAKLLKPHDPGAGSWDAKLVLVLDRTFNALHRRYENFLHGTLNWVPVTAVFSLVVLGCIYFLWATAKDELAPQEDQGVLIMSAQAAPNSTLQQRQLYTRAVYETFVKHPETDHVFQIDIPGQTLAGMVLKPWNERKATAARLLPGVTQELGQIAGLRAALFQPPPLPGAFGFPVQFVIQTTEPFDRLNGVASAFAQEAQKSGMFFFIDNDLRYDLPQSTVVHITTKTIPQALNRFQQQNAATIAGVPFIGVTQGDAIAYMQDLAARTLPQGYSVDYAGPSRQYVQESSALIITFLFALVVIFLALAAQFESFRDPVIILISVPMSICGALIFVNLFGTLGIGAVSLNIYTKVGLVTLIGLISKHGILIVEFANNLQKQGMSKREAVEKAAGIRLRPILMTTGAMVLGVVPLLIASGAGAVSRFNMGLVIATGVAIGTLFTLFVVPAMYLLLAEDHSRRATGEGLPAVGGRTGTH